MYRKGWVGGVLAVGMRGGVQSVTYQCRCCTAHQGIGGSKARSWHASAAARGVKRIASFEEKLPPAPALLCRNHRALPYRLQNEVFADLPTNQPGRMYSWKHAACSCPAVSQRPTCTTILCTADQPHSLPT